MVGLVVAMTVIATGKAGWVPSGILVATLFLL